MLEQMEESEMRDKIIIFNIDFWRFLSLASLSGTHTAVLLPSEHDNNKITFNTH